VLPPFLDEVRLYHLQVGSGEVDLVLHRYEETVGVEVARRSGAVEVATLT
jgi:Holliday junction resolvase-like predicted endonuclease